ncbi:hypothetical protein Blue_001 [Bacillus phage Deep Blue]|uniref:Uncharacterized protein n=1 Tax=Bacillus phage Deep Blue TaxID=1792245 RepID=A0A140HLG2_9CAUD|nr:hypothetical protein Blue_001 [Bacillus phage Deep Blue]AMO25824.1 hypothetical protein Blue_001 [Bacillus phage Deep Blue]
MKRILDTLLDASVTLQEVHHDLAVGDTSLAEDYVKAEIEVVQEQLELLVEAIEGFQKSEPVKDKKETLGEFIQRVTDSFEFAHETIKEMWAQSFEEAIKILENKRGYAGCVTPSSTGMIQGKLNVTSERITFVAGEEEFVFEKYEDNARAEEDDNSDYGEEDEGRWEEEESPCETCNCSYYCHDQVTLLEYIKEQESQKGDLTFKNLNLIEEHLNGKKVFDADDYELVRYHLKANPNASSHEVDTLSEFGLRLAWNARLYLAGKLK